MATSATEHDITWAWAEDVTIGQYVDGSWWVHAPSGLTLLSISRPNGLEHRDGTTINPDPTGLMGWDDRKFGYESEQYDQALNIARQLPYVVPAGSSVVSCISDPTGHIPSGSTEVRTYLESCSVLTVVASEPAANAFRPGFWGSTKTDYTTTGLRTDLLPGLTATASKPTLASVTSYVERVWLDTSNYFSKHPWRNCTDYGRDQAPMLSQAILYLMCDTGEDTTQLLHYMVQRGIDYLSYLMAGGEWEADGGHWHGRKLPMLFAAFMLDDVATFATSMSGKQFQEDDTTFYVEETSPGVYNQGYGGYTADDVGIADWGVRHRNYPDLDDADWSPESNTYRRCCTAGSWWAMIIAAIKFPGMRTQWAHEPLFDYMARYYQVESGEPWNSSYLVTGSIVSDAWGLEMWLEYAEDSDDDFTDLSITTSFGSLGELLDIGEMTLVCTAWGGTSDVRVYERADIVGDWVLFTAVRVDDRTGDYTFSLWLEAGHTGTTTTLVDRVTVSVDFDWTTDSITGILIDDVSSGARTVASGNGIPPTIWKWNRNTGAMVVDTSLGFFENIFYGRNTIAADGKFQMDAFQIWHVQPWASGVTDRFLFRFDPAREDSSTGRAALWNLSRGVQYTGSWIESATKKRVRGDQRQFVLQDLVGWYHNGLTGASGFWLSTSFNPRLTDAEWGDGVRHQHATAGNSVITQAVHYGGREWQTHPFWAQMVKKWAAILITRFARVGAPYTTSPWNQYTDRANRGSGRVLEAFVWMSTALSDLAATRTGDAEMNELNIEVGAAFFEKFNQIYLYHKTRVLLPGEAPIPAGRGYFVRGVTSTRDHPERGFQGVPASGDDAKINAVQNYQLGIFALGLIHVVERIKDAGLWDIVPQGRQAEALLQDIAYYGDGFYPGHLDHWHFWSSSARPHPIPSPLPPTWSQAPSSAWPTTPPDGYPNVGWAMYYYWPYSNWVPYTSRDLPDLRDADLYYLEGPSVATSVQSYAVLEYIKREGLAENDPFKAQKLDWILAQYAAGRTYRDTLGTTPLMVIADTVEIVESVQVIRESGGETYLAIETQFVDLEESLTMLIETLPPIIVVVEDGAFVDLVETTKFVLDSLRVLNETVEIAETVQTYFEGTIGNEFVIIVTEDLFVVDVEDPPREVRVIFRTTPTRTLPVRTGTATFTLPALEGSA